MPPDIAEFAVSLEELRGEFREGMAEVRGSINTLAATRDGEAQRVEAKLRDIRNDVTDNTSATKALHQRVDKYPPPKDVVETVTRVNRALWIGIGIALGAGGAGGGIGYALAQILGNPL